MIAVRCRFLAAQRQVHPRSLLSIRGWSLCAADFSSLSGKSTLALYTCALATAVYNWNSPISERAASIDCCLQCLCLDASLTACLAAAGVVAIAVDSRSGLAGRVVWPAAWLMAKVRSWRCEASGQQSWLDDGVAWSSLSLWNSPSLSLAISEGWQAADDGRRAL